MDDASEQPDGGESGRVDLEEVWRIREEEVYPRLFGPVNRGIFVLDQEVFAAFGISDPDPRWLMHGVFEFAPTATRASWLYVTSGYSNPWDDEPGDYSPTGDSGAGVEFVFETDRQGDWAVVQLRRLLALELLLAAGRIGNGSLGLHDRIPLKAPIDGEAGHAVDTVVVARSRWPDVALPSGEVMFVQFVGATASEVAFAVKDGTPALLERLRAAGAAPVIVPDRAPVV